MMVLKINRQKVMGVEDSHFKVMISKRIAVGVRDEVVVWSESM